MLVRAGDAAAVGGRRRVDVHLWRSETVGGGVSWHLRPSNDRADFLAFSATCPACGAKLEPLAVGNTTGITAWLPVKCSRHGCRREWAVRAQLVAVSEQQQAQYLSREAV